MKKAQERRPATVININRHGEIFDPRNYTVPIKGNEAFYAALVRLSDKAREDRR